MRRWWSISIWGDQLSRVADLDMKTSSHDQVVAAITGSDASGLAAPAAKPSA
jgi:hypothetical protein